MEVVLNESFKAFVRESFPQNCEAVTKLFEEVVNDRATKTHLNITDLKAQAIDEIKREFVTKDFVRAEIAGVKEELRAEIAGVKEELRAEIAGVKEELRAEIIQTKQELRSEIADVRLEIHKTKVDILKWVFGMQAATITIILSGIKFLI